MENWSRKFFKQNLPGSVSGKNNIYVPFLGYVHVTCPLLIKVQLCQYFTSSDLRLSSILFPFSKWWLDYKSKYLSTKQRFINSTNIEFFFTLP